MLRRSSCRRASRSASRSASLRSLLAGLLVVLVPALLASPLAAHAQPGDAAQARTDDPPLTTVAAVLDAPEDDRTVTLRGEILVQLSSDKYTFSDETGQIRVEIDPDDVSGVTVTVGLRVRITGEIETAFMRQPEIDVEALTMLPDAF